MKDKKKSETTNEVDVNIYRAMQNYIQYYLFSCTWKTQKMELVIY